jgi:secreted trypsin-like serine protease
LGEWDLTTDTDCELIGLDADCVTEPVQNIPIAETIAHPEWDEVHQHNDIALVRLQRPAQFNYYVKPICLPTTTELQNLNYHGAKFFISGWGTMDNGQKSAVKQKLAVPEVALETCKQKYENLERTPTNNHICAGGKLGRDSCKGDSGGPLMKLQKGAHRFWLLAGVVSYGPVICGTDGVPGVYTKVSSYMPWIMGNLRP